MGATKPHSSKHHMRKRKALLTHSSSSKSDDQSPFKPITSSKSSPYVINTLITPSSLPRYKKKRTAPMSNMRGITHNWDQALSNENNAMIEQLLRKHILPQDKHVQRAYGLYKEKILTVETMDSICRKICEHIRTKSVHIISVNACYKADDPNLVMLIAMADMEIKVDFDYEVRVCHPEGYSNEGYVITYHDDRRKKKFTTEESKEILATIQEHSNALFNKHSNLQIIDGCSVKSHGFGTKSSRIVKQTCIVLYVNVKGLIPLHGELLPAHLAIPGTGSYFSVDVREGGMRYLCKPNDYHQQLKMGCQILTDGKCSGTIGAFFEKNCKTYCLTSAHVFFDNEQFKQTLQITGQYNRHDYTPLSLDDMNISSHPAYKIPVYQNEKEPGNHIGVVTEAVLNEGNNKNAGMDIAIIEITEANRLPTEGSFPDGNYERAGFDQPMVYTTGKVYNQASFRDQTRVNTEVVKYGSRTEITRGLFDLEGPCVRRTDFIENKENNQQGWRLNNQLTVLATGDQKSNPFSNHGDSGALVFAKHGGKPSDLRAVGIIEGQMTNDKTVITPIWDICAYLKIRTDHGLKQFDFPIVNQDVVSADTSSPSSTTVARSNDTTYQEMQEVKQNQQRQNDKLETIEQRMNKMQKDHKKSIQLQKQNAESVETKFDMIMGKLSKNTP